MDIIVLAERMKNEGRVALTPKECCSIRGAGHRIFVESGAGEDSGFDDGDYLDNGAHAIPMHLIIPLLSSPNTVVFKVKQPLPADDLWLKHMENSTLFAYFHSTGETNPATINALLEKNITAISYENVRTEDGVYPLLVPMSEIAGRLAVEWGQALSSEAWAGAGKEPLENRNFCMTVFGGAGTVGMASVRKGIKRGFACITVFEKDASRKQAFFDHFPPKTTLRTQLRFHSLDENFGPKMDYTDAVRIALANTNLLVGAVLVPGGHAPLVVSEKDLKAMQKGNVVVDVACDQGGCIWYPEEHAENIFEHEGKVFCRTPNMPGSVPKESAPILAEAIFPYLMDILKKGRDGALQSNAGLRKGLLSYKGAVMNAQAAKYWGLEYVDPDTVFVR